jgi:hypothetical protein
LEQRHLHAVYSTEKHHDFGVKLRNVLCWLRWQTE